jgi:hypothetical protein
MRARCVGAFATLSSRGKTPAAEAPRFHRPIDLWKQLIGLKKQNPSREAA